MRVLFYYLDFICIGLLLIVVNTNASLVSIISLSVAIICSTIGICLDDETLNRKFEDIIRRKK